MKINCHRLVWLVGIFLLLAACSLGDQGLSHPGSKPTPRSPSLVFTWHQENQDELYCNEIKLYRNGAFIQQSCMSGEISFRGILDETHIHLMASALEKYPYLNITFPQPDEKIQEWVLFLGELDVEVTTPDGDLPPEISALFVHIQELIKPDETPPDISEITGIVCYPNDVPQQLEIFFLNQWDEKLYQMTHQPETEAISAPLPDGKYQVFAWAPDAQIGGGYTGERACDGRGVMCSNVDLETVTLESGTPPKAVSVCSWGLISLPFPWLRWDRAFPYTPSDLSGLVYSTEDGLRRMVGPETPQDILGDDLAILSPDLTHALFAKEGDLFLFKLGTDELRNLTNTSDRVEQVSQWQVTRNGQLLFLSSPTASDTVSHRTGYLTAINLDGSGYQVLDADRLTQSFALAPDGDTIAYGAGVNAWLYHPMTGSNPFDLRTAGQEQFTTVTNPAWSPDHRWLAWQVMDEDQRAYMLLTDLHPNEMESRLLLPHQPPNADIMPEPGIWSHDSKWFAVNLYDINPDLTGIWVISANPDFQPILLGKAGNPIWRPDSRQLLLFSFETQGWLLADSETWETVIINGPPGVSYPTQWLMP